jgi:hypothetical protein
MDHSTLAGLPQGKMLVVVVVGRTVNAPILMFLYVSWNTPYTPKFGQDCKADDIADMKYVT